MNVDNVRSQMRKGMLEYCILLLLHKEPSYASDIIQKLKEARLIVVEGTLYPLLTRLKNDDLLVNIIVSLLRVKHSLADWRLPGRSWRIQ